ncbi:MAG: hypothetical protein ACI3V3_02315 [Faecousia sp.]
MEDHEIVALYLCRDEAAIQQTSEKFGNRLRALAYGIVHDLQTAEECENDTYMEAWNSIPPHEPKLPVCFSGAHHPPYFPELLSRAQPSEARRVSMRTQRGAGAMHSGPG